jgi:hypothetical protein
MHLDPHPTSLDPTKPNQSHTEASKALPKVDINCPFVFFVRKHIANEWFMFKHRMGPILDVNYGYGIQATS